MVAGPLAEAQTAADVRLGDVVRTAQQGKTFTPEPGPPISLSPAPSLPANPPVAVQAASLAASNWVSNDHARARLISAVSAVGKDAKSLALGLEFKLASDWKIYWRSPGDAGYPPRLDLAGSHNVAKADFAWPVPERYTIFGLTTFVYHDAVLLPLTVVPERPGDPVSLRAKLDYLLCDKICIPYEANLALDLPAGEAMPTEYSAQLERAAARVPRLIGMNENATAPFAVRHATLTPEADGLTLEVLAAAQEPFAKPDLIVEGPRPLSFGVPQISLSEGGKLALMRVPVGAGGATGMLPAEPALTMTLIDGSRAIEQDVVAATAAPREAAQFATILGLALLGGLILNLMPCVLPVLSLKLMGAVRQSGRPAREVRASFLATAVGILAAFLVLAGGAIAVKSAGVAVGWGIQFQQPVFLIAMAAVLTLFACSLWGAFHIRLPGSVTDAAATAGTRRGLLGDVATGAFATLLATPCSAPFLGTAIGFALTRGSVEILAVFAALGLGLASPYLLVALIPRLARLMPKPGPWMPWLSRILGIVLALTAVWLLSVLASQTGAATALLAGLCLVALAAALTLRIAARDGSFLRRAGWPLAGAFGVLALAVVLAMPQSRERSNELDLAWQSFDRVQIINAVATGQVVLVDVTAEWCVTCQANKKLVLDRGPVRERIETGKVLALRADWTRPDPAIAEYLAGFGRYGIPFNAVYGPAAPGGIALSELLTEAEVLAAFDKAAGATVAAK